MGCQNDTTITSVSRVGCDSLVPEESPIFLFLFLLLYYQISELKRTRFAMSLPPQCRFGFFLNKLIRVSPLVARWESFRMSCFRSWCLLIELLGIVFLAAVRTSGFPTSHVSDFALWLLCDTAQSSHLFPFISRRLFPLDRAIGFFVVLFPRAILHVAFPLVRDDCATRLGLFSSFLCGFLCYGTACLRLF
jgi:hypothetical protein